MLFAGALNFLALEKAFPQKRRWVKLPVSLHITLVLSDFSFPCLQLNLEIHDNYLHE